jgi:hypothetical protein
MSEFSKQSFNPLLNAAIGTNAGGDNEFGYIDGFATASEVLLSAAIRQTYTAADGTEAAILLDTLIYPILFCARHHMELLLKSAIKRVSTLRGGEQQVATGHDLGDLLKELSLLCGVHDSRLVEKLAKLEVTISEFASIDRTGQTFRYAYDTDNVLHLADLDTINVEALGISIGHFNAAATDFEFCLEALEEEYGYATKTSKLSHAQLFELAKALPCKREWAASERFKEVKRDFIKKYSLSSRDFQRAIYAIQGSYSLVRMIGEIKPLPHVEPTDIDVFAGSAPAGECGTLLSETKWHAWMAIYRVAHECQPADYFDIKLAKYRAGESQIYPHDVVRLTRQQPSKFIAALEILGQPTLLGEFQQRMGEYIEAERRAPNQPRLSGAHE